MINRKEIHKMMTLRIRSFSHKNAHVANLDISLPTHISNFISFDKFEVSNVVYRKDYHAAIGFGPVNQAEYRLPHALQTEQLDIWENHSLWRPRIHR